MVSCQDSSREPINELFIVIDCTCFGCSYSALEHLIEYVLKSKLTIGTAKSILS